MSLRTCATLMVKLLAAAVILGWVAFAGGGAVRAPCAVTAALMLVAVCLIHRLFWPVLFRFSTRRMMMWADFSYSHPKTTVYLIFSMGRIILPTWGQSGAAWLYMGKMAFNEPSITLKIRLSAPSSSMMWTK